MADFTELDVRDGVGDWHLNRFRIAFEPKGTSAVILAHSLLANFPTYINSDYATAKWGDRKYDDQRTVHFHGIAKIVGIDIGQPHSDWVAIVSLDPNSLGFTVQTLKREFTDTTEDGETTLGGALLGVAFPFIGLVEGAVLGGTAGSHYNRMHFLAGRRAWRINSGSDFGLSNDVMVLETVAVERFSAEVYDIADSVIGLEKRLPNVWLSFLNNFVNQMGLKPVDQALKPQWKKDSLAMYYQRSFGNVVALMGDMEFLNVNKLYPRILGN